MKTVLKPPRNPLPLLMQLDGPGRPPTCYSTHLAEVFDSQGVTQQFMKLSSRDRRQNFANSRIQGALPSLRYLYKYRSIEPDNTESVQKLRSLIVEDRIWMASPSSLNDPQDMDFTIIENPNLEDRRRWAKENSGLLAAMPPAKRLQMLQRIKRARMTPSQISSFKSDQQEHLGVFCASQNPRSDLLWTHYADSHRGISVQLAPYEDELFLFAQPVRYTSSFPTVTVPTPKDRVQDHYLYKSPSWSYETEWRVVAPVQNCFVQLRAHAISGVILGARSNDAVRKCVADLCAERSQLQKPALQVYRSKLKSGRYGVSIMRDS